jgi:hypothetical protein
MMKHALLSGCVVMFSVECAVAQAPQPATAPSAPMAPAASSGDCTPTKPVPPRGTVMPEGTTGQANEPLSDRLAKSNGVLCPPEGIDPQMRAPAPDVGNMPVIPPPGSPGGSPNVKPK